MQTAGSTIRCRKCNFWVTSQETFCQNCGIIKPTLQEVDTSDTTDITNLYFTQKTIVTCKTTSFFIAAIPIFCLIALIPIMLSIALIVKLSGMVVFSFLGGVLAVLAVTIILKKLALENERRFEQCFMNTEELIQNRLQTINLEEERALSFLEQNNGTETPNAKLRIQLLQNALATWGVQKEKYMQKMSEIKVFRWLNELKPYISGFRENNFQILENHINIINSIIGKGQALREELVGDSQKRLDNTLATCNQLIEDLEDQKVAAMTKSVSALDAAIPDIASNRRLESEHNLLNAMTSLTQFNSGMQALEQEFYRLKGEKEVESWCAE